MGPSQFDHQKLEGFVVLQRIKSGKEKDGMDLTAERRTVNGER
jgi:hypothetical protein